MALPLTTTVFTTTVTNSSLVISSSNNLRAISVYNTTSTTGTVTGTVALGSTSSSAINVAESESYNITALESSVLDGITITAPSGCSLAVTGLQ